MKNNKGFALIEGLLILLIIGMLSGVGYYVYITKKNSDKSLDSAASTEITAAGKAAKKETAEDPTKDWKPYSSAEGQFSLKYPSTWAQPARTDICSPGLLLLGANANTVGSCGSAAPTHMRIFSVAGDKRTESELKSTDYTELKSESVAVDETTGKKQTGKYKGGPEGQGHGPAIGEVRTQYVFYANSRTYQVIYNAVADYPDVLSDFNTMVTKTLKFEP